MEHIEFETREVPTPTVEAVADLVRRGEQLVVVGSPGTGRSTAVARATRGEAAVRLVYGYGRARAVRALRQAAATVPGGRDLLERYAREGLPAALRQLDDLVGDRVVVIDDADRMLQATPDGEAWIDAVPGMVAPADLAWAEWIAGRHGPAVLVGTRPGVHPLKVVEHRLEDRWPIAVRRADGGMRDWPALAKKLGPRLDWFWLARAAAPLMSAASFNALVRDATRDEILGELARVFRAGAGQRVMALDLIATLGGASESVVRKALAVELPRRDQDPLAWLRSQDDLFEDLRKAHLVSVSGPDDGTDGEVLPAAALMEWDAVRPLSATRCGRMARRLLATVNDPHDLDPACASLVLTAHDLAVSAGDEDLALETATLHVHGLVHLARTISRDDRDHRAAWRLYHRIEPLVSAERVARDKSLRRVRSYVLNYRARNGLLARQLDPAHALADVVEATHLWPENARWHGQRIELLLELGRVSDAWRALAEAEQQVEDHPQRARHLRVRPAVECIRLGLVRVGLEMMQLADKPWREDDEARSIIRRVLERLASGVSVSELASASARVVFRNPQDLRVVWRPGGAAPWSATLAELDVSRTGRNVLTTLDALIEALAGEVASLVRRPTPWLSAGDASRKGELLAIVDVLNSDIGLSHASERWFVGRIEGRTLVPMDSRVDGAIPLDDALELQGGADPKGLWFGRAQVDRAGFPTGPITTLQPAGSGRTLDELRDALVELWGEAAS